MAQITISPPSIIGATAKRLTRGVSWSVLVANKASLDCIKFDQNGAEFTHYPAILK